MVKFKKALKIRNLDHLTMKELGVKLNVTKQAIHFWMNGGQISLKNAPHVAKVLNVSVSWLIFNEGPMTRFENFSKKDKITLKRIYGTQ